MASALSGIEFTLMPPRMVPRLSVVRGSSGSGVSASAASAVASAAMGLGVPASVKLWPPGPGDRDPIAPAAQRLRHGRVRAGAIQHNVRGNAAGQRAVLVEVAHAAQIAFALFAHIAQQDERRGQFDLGFEQRMGDGQHSHHSGAVVAGARSLQAVAVDDRIERRAGGKDGIKVRREQDHRPGALGRQIRGGQDPQAHCPAASVSTSLRPASSKTRRQPLARAPARRTAARECPPGAPASP